MQTHNFIIYALVDSATGEPFYVGSTCGTLGNRFKEHVGQSRRRRKDKLYAFFRCVGRNVTIKQLEIIVFATLEDALIKEQYWFDKLRSEGATLYNKGNPIGKRNKTLREKYKLII